MQHMLRILLMPILLLISFPHACAGPSSQLSASAASAAVFVPSNSSSNIANANRLASMSSAAAPFVPKAGAMLFSQWDLLEFKVSCHCLGLRLQLKAVQLTLCCIVPCLQSPSTPQRARLPTAMQSGAQAGMISCCQMGMISWA